MLWAAVNSRSLTDLPLLRGHMRRYCGPARGVTAGAFDESRTLPVGGVFHRTFTYLARYDGAPAACTRWLHRAVTNEHALVAPGDYK